MTTLILDGKSLSKNYEAEFGERVAKLKEKTGIFPILATILVGDDPSSAIYVKMKGSACARVGMQSERIVLPQDTTTEQLIAKIKQLNSNKNCHGILLQHPVPKQINERACFDAIDLEKDVDGVTCLGFGRMSMNESAYRSATPGGIIRLLKHYKISLSGKLVAVVGRSPILGKPLAMMLLNENATVTICHSKTENLSAIIKQADIVCGAVGKPEFIRADWIKDGAVVIDAGYHSGGVGDVELKNLKHRVLAYTPVPGGVGPMTINTLIEQTIEVAEKSYLKPKNR